jgi:hypothetical protein
MKKAVMTIALPMFNSKDIAWIAFEGLCRQTGCEDIPWELIVLEDGDDRLGIEGVEAYNLRLIEAGCVKVRYVGFDERKSLPFKWQYAGSLASESSIGFMLHGADDMSHSKRVALSHKAMKDGNDWYDNSMGLFYNVKTKDVMLYSNEGNAYFTCPNICFPTKYARVIPDSDIERGVDGFLFLYIQDSIGRKMKIKRDVNLYDDGLYTDGFNTISMKRRAIYQNPKPPFVRTGTKIENTRVSMEVIERLLSYYVAPSEAHAILRRVEEMIVRAGKPSTAMKIGYTKACEEIKKAIIREYGEPEV